MLQLRLQIVIEEELYREVKVGNVVKIIVNERKNGALQRVDS